MIRNGGTHRGSSRWDDSELLGTIVRSVWQWQLVIALSAVTVAVVIASLDVALFQNWWFLSGLLLIAVVTVTGLAAPWARQKKYAIALPIIDTIAIGFLANANHILGYLWIMPIAWIAAYYTSTAILAALALVVASQAARRWLPATDAPKPLEVIIVLVALGFLGIAMSQGARRTRAFRHLLRRQSSQIDRALSRATVQERRTVALFDSIGTALAVIDRHGRIEKSNAAYRTLYGYSEGEERHPARAVEYSDYRGSALALDETAVARARRGERVRNEPLWIYDTDGRWRALSLSIRSRATSTPSEDAGAIIELDDVTATETGRRAQRAAASAVSHELRNPLTVILGHAGLLLDDEALTPAQREHASLIDAAAERMLELTARLLDANRPADTGDAFDLTSITASAVESFGPAAAAVDIRLTVDDESELTVLGDGFRMRQVVDNLVSNAIKYTPRGGAVHVALRRDARTAALSVRDTGIGIAADDLENVFRPYFRARSATAGGIPGTGLGMSIVRSIVEDNHGTITLESALGSGTTATVTLPVAVPEDSPDLTDPADPAEGGAR